MESTEIQDFIERIRQMAQDVYDELRSGYDEFIYREALMVELRNAHISYERERHVTILYRDHVVGVGRADIVVLPPKAESIPIECKKTGLKEDDRQQLRTYMKGMGDACTHGILISFPQPGKHKSEKTETPTFYWARKDARGDVMFYQRERDGAWMPDENFKRAAQRSKASEKAKHAAPPAR